MCWVGVWGEVKKNVGRGVGGVEKCGERCGESVLGEWGSELRCGGRCREVCSVWRKG